MLGLNPEALEEFCPSVWTPGRSQLQTTKLLSTSNHIRGHEGLVEQTHSSGPGNHLFYTLPRKPLLYIILFLSFLPSTLLSSFLNSLLSSFPPSLPSLFSFFSDRSPVVQAGLKLIMYLRMTQILESPGTHPWENVVYILQLSVVQSLTAKSGQRSTCTVGEYFCT